MECGDSVKRWMFPLIFLESADYEEQYVPFNVNVSLANRGQQMHNMPYPRSEREMPMSKVLDLERGSSCFRDYSKGTHSSRCHQDVKRSGGMQRKRWTGRNIEASQLMTLSGMSESITVLLSTLLTRIFAEYVYGNSKQWPISCCDIRQPSLSRWRLVGWSYVSAAQGTYLADGKKICNEGWRAVSLFLLLQFSAIDSQYPDSSGFPGGLVLVTLKKVYSSSPSMMAQNTMMFQRYYIFHDVSNILTIVRA